MIEAEQAARADGGELLRGGLVLDHDRHGIEALAELRRALYSSPYEADAHLLLGRIHLRGGRTAETVKVFNQRDGEPVYILQRVR